MTLAMDPVDINIAIAKAPTWFLMAQWRDIERRHARGELLLRAALGRHGLTLTLYNLLAALSEAGGQRLRAADLAAAINMTRGGVTRAVDLAVERGWVGREWVVEDSRGRLISLLPAGRDVRDAAREDYVEAIEAALS